MGVEIRAPIGNGDLARSLTKGPLKPYWTVVASSRPFIWAIKRGWAECRKGPPIMVRLTRHGLAVRNQCMVLNAEARDRS